MHRMHRFLTTLVAAWGAAILTAGAARAHVTVTPTFLEVGKSETVSFEAPNERDGQPMTALVLSLPAGISAEGSQPATAGWSLRVEGQTVSWSGGSLAPRALATFAVRLRAGGEPRAVTVKAVQHYPDGGTVAWTPAFTVLPAAADAPQQYPGRALVAAVVGLAVIGASLVLARRIRQRSLQEE
jgi:uncharacterized protein YcnI